MKLLIPLFLFTALISTSAHAHPGSNYLVCKSAKNSGSKQSVEVSLVRSNGTGWYAPTIEMKVADKKFQLTTPDENNNYGVTFHNSPLKVITVTADVPYAEGINAGNFSIVAMPETVKAYDNENQPVKWSLEKEKEECSDSNGKAIFQAIIHGYMNVEGSAVDVDTQILDCVLTYTSGMAC